MNVPCSTVSAVILFLLFTCLLAVFFVVCHRYREDFGRNDNEIVQWIQSHGGEALSNQLYRQTNPKWKLKYGTYDWGIND